jgi:hypothetical protein
MIGPTSPAQSVRSGMSSPGPALPCLVESDKEDSDTSSSSDQPLYSAAVANFSTLSVPTSENLAPCESAKASLGKVVKSRTVSFEEAKANLTEIWPFAGADVKNVRVKKPTLVKVRPMDNPLATTLPMTPPAEEDRLLNLNLDSLSPDKPVAERLEEAEKLLAEFQQAYKTRSMSIHELEKHIDDQSTQLKESEIWSESLGRRMMSLTSRISEQESAILQLGQELGKEKEKRQQEEDEAFQHKLDGLTRIYPPVTEAIARRMSVLPNVSHSTGAGDAQTHVRDLRDPSAHSAGTARYVSRHSSTASSGSFSAAAGYQRRPSFFAKFFRQPSESGSSSDGTSSPPHSRLSSFSSRASILLNGSSVKISSPDAQLQSATERVVALEKIRTECDVLRQRLQSLELALTSLNDPAPKPVESPGMAASEK